MKHPVFFAALAASFLPAPAAGDGDADGGDETGEHPGWPRWCGKVYESGYPAFEPGGHTTAPTNATLPGDPPLLHVQLAARHSIYVAPEAAGSFIVSAALSPWYGAPYHETWLPGAGGGGGGGNGTARPFTEVVFSIHLVADDGGDGVPLVQDARIPVNVSGAEYAFDLAPSAPGGIGIAPRLEPYQVVLFGGPEPGSREYTARAELSYLPAVPPESGGSATKIDRLTGSLLFRGPGSGSGGKQEWTPLLPYGYYGLYNGSNDTAAADEFVRDYTSDGTGLNAIIALAGFADTNPVYDSMDAQGLHFMFDLRGSYLNLTETELRVNTIKNRGMLFAYWTADE